MSIRAASVLLCCVLGGCIAIPYPVIPEENRFAERITELVMPGESTRADVVARFGPPDLTRMESRLVVYGHARTVGGVLVGTGSGYYGAADTFPIETHTMLIVRYDGDGVVTRHDTLRGTEECTDDGLCVVAEFGAAGHADLSTAVVVQREAPDACGVLPGAEHCAMSVYVTGTEEIVKVHSVPTGTVRLNEQGNLYCTATPGTLKLHAVLAELVQHAFECEAGQVHFVQINSVDRGLWSDDRLEVSTVGEAAGREAIAERMRIVNWGAVQHTSPLWLHAHGTSCPCQSVLAYSKIMPWLSMTKRLPSTVPVVTPAPVHCIVSVEPSTSYAAR